MREAIKEEIGVWKENLKAVIYLFVLDLTATVARAVKVNVTDIWVFSGVLGLLVITLVYILVWRKIAKLLELLKGVESD